MSINSATALTCKGDVYGGITVRTEESHETDFGAAIPSADVAREKLVCSLKHWEETEINGVWFEVNIKHAFWVPLLVEQGFIFHHAYADKVMLTKWLPQDKPCTLPRFPFTNVGVGGIVENEKGEILLMKERRGMYLGWKFPGGLADPNEPIPDAAIREVLEETGVETEFVGVICFRHVNQTLYKDCSDLYFLCHLKPKDPKKIEVKPCPAEAAAAQWMPREEIKNLPSAEFHQFHHVVLDRFDKLQAAGRRGVFREMFETGRAAWKPWHMFYVDS